MHIVICSSIDFTSEIKSISEQLKEMGHTVDIPLTSEKIINGELSMDDYLAEKETSAESAVRKIADDVIRGYFQRIKEADAIFVLNLKKKGIPNYIGGNTFLEMGFAHVLHKSIYLFNELPNMPYKDELLAFQPIILNQNLTQLATKK